MNGSTQSRFETGAKKLLLLWHAVVLTIAIAAIWLALVGGYQAKSLFVKFNQAEVPGNTPEVAVWFLKHLNLCYDGLYVIGGVGVMLLLMALIPWFGPTWPVRGARGLQWLAGTAVILGLAAGSASIIANFFAAQHAMIETLYYKNALERFAILETAEGRLEQFRDNMRKHSRMEFKTVSRLSEMPNDVRYDRIKGLFATMRDHPTPVIQKAILATLSDLDFTERVSGRTDLHSLSSEERNLLLGAVASLANREFKTVEDAMGWVKQQPESEGWKQMPWFYTVEKTPRILR